MKKPDPFIIGVLLITFAVIGGVILASIRAGGKPINQYSPADANRPRIEISETVFDFGDMKVSDIKTREIAVKNSGTAPLVISDMISSCNCTFGQMVIDGVESPRFSMHRNPDWRGQILPGASAILKITYEPRLMPVQGKVQRAVVFKTNDPEKQLITITASANVQ